MAINPEASSRPLHQIDAVIWDYDGTLVNSRCADEAAVATLVALDPSAAAGAEIFWAAEGMPIARRVSMAWPGRLGEVLPLFEARIAPFVFDGVRAALEVIADRGLPMAVVSSRQREALLWGLEATGLREHFPTVIGLDDVRRPKPSPEGLLRASAALVVGPSRCVYVGDSVLDVEAAASAGMAGWRATWSLDISDEPEVIAVRSPSEVIKRLGAPTPRVVPRRGAEPRDGRPWPTPRDSRPPSKTA